MTDDFVSQIEEQKSEYVELALCSASVADTIGMIFANVLGLMVPWCFPKGELPTETDDGLLM